MNSRPILSNAFANLTHDVAAVEERGRASTISIPAERPLTVYVDKRELVTLMTLGGAPEGRTPGPPTASFAGSVRPGGIRPMCGSICRACHWGRWR